MTQKKQLNLISDQLIGYCLEEIELRLKENGCYNIEHYKTKNSLVFRCSKPVNKRKNVWDHWWFRLTSSGMRLPPEYAEEIRSHTVCIDGMHRLEAYPSE